jgi:hypothetical protein
MMMVGQLFFVEKTKKGQFWIFILYFFRKQSDAAVARPRDTFQIVTKLMVGRRGVKKLNEWRKIENNIEFHGRKMNERGFHS